MRISPQNLLKADLIGDPGVIESALPVGKCDHARAFQPRGDLRYSGRVRYKAGGRQHQIVVHIVALERRQTTGASGNIGVRRPLGWDRDGRLLGDMDAKLSTAHAVP
ncbi:hypothetical protein SDC9_188014 [bioreactor metagenome]|uniref:Uncharacterized protein n=1 Tax=bioreactor metagenome TaxID=1076179 RepID=A0A645HPH5_9ZZZZ